MTMTPVAVQPPSSRGRWVAIGLAMVVIGAAAMVALWFVAAERVDRSAAGLARAPVGCDTTLEFTDTGTFVLFIETRGRIDDLDGRCEAPERYERSSARLPEVSITVTDPAGRPIGLRPSAPATYDAGGFAGTAHREVEITATGRHVVRVESDASDVVVAVGRDPSSAGDGLRLTGLLGGGVVAAAGVVVLVLGLVRRPRSEQVLPVVPAGDEPWAGAVVVPAPIAPPPPPPSPGAVTGPPAAHRPAEGLPPPSGPPLG